MIMIEKTKSNDSDTLKALYQLVNGNDVSFAGLSRTTVYRLNKYSDQLKALNTTSIQEGKVGQLERFLSKMESLPATIRPQFSGIKHTATLLESTNQYLALLTEEELNSGRIKIKQSANWNELTEEITRLIKLLRPLRINADVTLYMLASEEDRVWIKLPYQGKYTSDILQDGGPTTYCIHLLKIIINACAQKALSRKTFCPGLEMLDLDKSYHLDLLMSEALAGAM
ncbi:hypothetical protein RJ45_09480 [Photobacterium gaetbulicola]|uniref:Uncharacterized protein n=1 Tax=Photobacterium gaetbulicola TaxID=1295392 RepID=A0A0B9G5M2_9GAMM|nr:hypothetical protein [Photobacterium gaetbulicola]KHT63919.1 hypothetical protein RJ45_09480 [Photobacterium gaetbulicola]